MSIRVVVADDQDLVRTGLVMILGAQPDLEVVGEAADGLTALDLATRLRPDVLLVDIRMPGLDGVEVTRRVAGPAVTDPLAVVNNFLHSLSTFKSVSLFFNVLRPLQWCFGIVQRLPRNGLAKGNVERALFVFE